MHIFVNPIASDPGNDVRKSSCQVNQGSYKIIAAILGSLERIMLL